MYECQVERAGAEEADQERESGVSAEAGAVDGGEAGMLAGADGEVDRLDEERVVRLQADQEGSG